ncbi:MAG: hypothetical protein QOF44_5681 [Streptomyces sp.]|nr:hypothetical protein [Streptomyces sp.]
MLPSPSPSAEHAVNQGVSVRETTWTDPVGDRLRAAQRAELSLRYADLNAHHGFPKPPPDLTPDQVIATVVAEDTRTGHGVGTANLKLFDGIPEVKRLYVAPTHRGQGVGAAVLAALERIALRRGADRLILSTGPLQPDAVRLYEKTGWTPIPPFGAAKRFPGGFFFEKAL